ncbi:MAG: vWA domain-containing protein [Planctomycetota bacterium]|jgi:Ca-activated chloride channel family protein
MTTNDDLDRVLGGARVETTPEQDARVLAAAGRALWRPQRWGWIPVAAAAALLALVVLGSPREPEPEYDKRYVAQRDLTHQPLPTNGQEVLRGLGYVDGKVKVTFSESLNPASLVDNAFETIVVTSPERYLRSDSALNGARLTFNRRPLVDLEDVTSGLEDHHTEGYDAIVENPFLDPSRAPLSTFSIDVDTASYANVRRILDAGRLPPAGAVRIEELVNYFTYDYPAPQGDVPFSVVTEVAECPWNPGHRLVHVGIQGRRIAEEQLPPRNLVFLLDVSGSMRPPDKLPLVKAALRLLVERVGVKDRIAVVVYAGASGVVLEPTSGDRRGDILDAIDRLDAGGSTNAGEGIRLAYAMARKHFQTGAINRVILATDGDFNVGVTSRSELLELIEEERESGVFLTVLGVGTGNLKDSQMEMLADKGNGNYAYLDSVAEARKVLVREAGGTLVTIAKDVKIQVEFNPNLVGAYRLIGYENRLLRARDFNDDTKDAGEIGAGHSVTALYEITPPGERPDETDPLKYQAPTVPSGEAFTNEILTLKLRYKEPDGAESRLIRSPVQDPGNVTFGAASPDFRFSAAVAAFGLLLRSSEFKGEATFALVRDIAHGSLGEDAQGDRRELMELVDLAARLPEGD